MLQATRLYGEDDPLLKSIFDRISDAVVCCDDGGRISHFNLAACRFFHCSANEAIGKSLGRFFALSNNVLSVQPGLTHLSIEPLQGTEHLTSVHATVENLPTEKGRSFSIVFRTSDEDQDRNKDSARLAAIVESSDDAIIGKTLDGNITSWNKGAERIFGHIAEEIVGKHISTLIPAGREGEEPEILERLRAGERVDHFDTVRVTKSGHYVDVSLTISPIRDENGRIVGASKIARDISDRKRDALARDIIEQRMRLAVEAAQIGIWDWDLQSSKLVWSRRFADIFGLESLTGTFEVFENCLHPDDRASTLERVQEALESKSEYRHEYRVVWADKSVHWIQSRGQAICDGHDTTRRMTGTVIDVTEQKAARAAADIA